MGFLNHWKIIRYKIIFPRQLSIGIFFLKVLFDKDYCRGLTSQLKFYKEGTIGNALWKFLQNNEIELVPMYERHDLKHVILGFDTSPDNEMRMQTFMFGNAGFPLFITIVFLTFVIWTPEMWRDIPYYYQLGKMTKPLCDYTLEELLDWDLIDFRRFIGLEKAKYLLANKELYNKGF